MLYFLMGFPYQSSSGQKHDRIGRQIWNIKIWTVFKTIKKLLSFLLGLFLWHAEQFFFIPQFTLSSYLLISNYTLAAALKFACVFEIFSEEKTCTAKPYNVIGLFHCFVSCSMVLQNSNLKAGEGRLIKFYLSFYLVCK